MWLLFSVVAMSLVGYSERLEHIRDFSITSMVGMVLTFCFGAVAVAVDPVIATAAAVITAIILDNKEGIHGWVFRLKAHELDAALKLLLISVVVLPLLLALPVSFSVWPTWMVSPRSPFRDLMAETEVPCFAAMVDSVSPRFTV